MKRTVEICDLDAAVKALESEGCYTTKCLIAQFAKRITGREIYGSTTTTVSFEHNDHYPFSVFGMENLINLFDDEDFDKIRRLLPQEVEVEKV